MPRPQHIDDLLRAWPYDPDGIQVRKIPGYDGREVLQVRIDLGVLQLETEGRPDGTRPHGKESFYDHLVELAFHRGDEFELSDEQCYEVDREFVQFYHRRHCWLRLREFRRAIQDSDHTLQMMDFCLAHSSDEEWTLSHEQYRPFVLFDRTQAAAMEALEQRGAEKAVAEIDAGLEAIRLVFADHDAEEHYADHELVVRLKELQEAMRDQYDDNSRLRKELNDAIAAEDYERAAKLRDQLAALNRKPDV